MAPLAPPFPPPMQRPYTKSLKCIILLYVFYNVTFSLNIAKFEGLFKPKTLFMH